MKKVLIIIIMFIFIAGCTSIKDLNYDSIVNTFSAKQSKPNEYRTGYKYFLPRGMQVKDSTLYNEVLDDGAYLYYLYVDVISYYNKVENPYEVSANSVYSRRIDSDGKSGYVEINLKENNQYLVEIMYNYAKIEVIVDKDNLNESMLSAINILKSIEYNDNIIANILGDNILSFKEEKFSIFKTHSDDDGYIQVIDDYEKIVEEIPDTDLIN